jgi:hypothetical protein
VIKPLNETIKKHNAVSQEKQVNMLDKLRMQEKIDVLNIKLEEI